MSYKEMTGTKICNVFASGLALLMLIAFALFSCSSTEKKSHVDVSASAEDEAAGQQEEVKPPDFIIGVGDTVEISVYRNEDLDTSVKIDFSGIVTYPMIGDVQAAGKTVTELREELRSRLSEYIINPQVGVRISAIQSQKVVVLGEVNTPSVFPFDQQLRVTEVIAKAGGYTSDAKTGKIMIFRRGEDGTAVHTYNMKKAFKEGDLSSDIRVQNGDIVFVPARTIAKISRVFTNIGRILAPILALEGGVVLWPDFKAVLTGEEAGGGSSVIISAD